MATWPVGKFPNTDVENSDKYDNILVSPDLLDCLDESFDLPTFNRVFEQSPVYTSTRLSEEENPGTSSYIGKLGDGEEG